MGDTDYYGYVPGSVERLRRAGWIARHMGDDITHYPDLGEHSYQDTPKPPDSISSDSDTRNLMRNSIEHVHKRILGQSYTMVQDAANGWRDIADYLTNLSGQIRGQSDALRAGGGKGDPGWHSDGADAFMARGPGATMMSIDEWAEAAQVNHDGLSSLATTIAIYHGRIKDLWDDYKKAVVAAAQRFFFQDQNSYIWGDNPPQQVDDPEDIDVDAWQRALNRDTLWTEQDRYMDTLKQEEMIWTARAQSLEYEMAQQYWQVMGHELNGGTATVFEGPDNAVVPKGPPGMDYKKLLAAQDAAQAAANAAQNLNDKLPAIDTSDLTKLAAQTQQSQALIDDLHHKTATADDALQLADQVNNLPNVPDLPNVQTPSATPGLPPVVPPAVLPNLGNLPGTSGLPTPNPRGINQSAFSNLPGTGRLPNGVLGNPNAPGANATPSAAPPPAMKGGKVLGKPKGPQEALPQRPGAPGSLPPAIPRGGRPGQRATQGFQDPATGRLGGPPPKTTEPVLGGRKQAGGPTEPGLPAARSGPARPGTAPPVLGNKPAGKSGRGGPPQGTPASPGTGTPPQQAPGRSRGRPSSQDRLDAPMEITHLFPTSDEMGTTVPTLQRRGPAAPAPRDVGEIPRSLRASRPVIASPAETAARRRAAKAVQEEKERERLEDNYQQIKAFMGGEQAWTVQTPGGPVMGAAERPAPSAEPRPALGGS